MADKETEQLETVGQYVMWRTDYSDHTSYWVSDMEGVELVDYETFKEARAWIAGAMCGKARA